MFRYCWLFTTLAFRLMNDDYPRYVTFMFSTLLKDENTCLPYLQASKLGDPTDLERLLEGNLDREVTKSVQPLYSPAARVKERCPPCLPPPQPKTPAISQTQITILTN